MAEAQLRDQHGNAIQLTDQYGNPVMLTDEHGQPVRITGVATPATDTPLGLGGSGATAIPAFGTTTYGGAAPTVTGTGIGTHHSHTGATGLGGARTGLGTYGGGAYGGGATTDKTTMADLMATKHKNETPVYDPNVYREKEAGELRRSNSSSSSSSEDDGQGGRRKKKGLKDKIKEKLPVGGGGAKEHSHTTTTATTGATTGATGASRPTTTTAGTGSVAHNPEHEKKSFMEKIKEKLPGHHSPH